jgi:hypothetical protein
LVTGLVGDLARRGLVDVASLASVAATGGGDRGGVAGGVSDIGGAISSVSCQAGSGTADWPPAQASWPTTESINWAVVQPACVLVWT